MPSTRYLVFALVVVLTAVCAYHVAKYMLSAQYKDLMRLRHKVQILNKKIPGKGGELRPPPSAETLLAEKDFAAYQLEVNDLIARAHRRGYFGKYEELGGACAHALQGGKRLRSIIVLEIARGVAAANPGTHHPVDAAEAALAVEFLHTASLVLDDLPVFDDDAVRRGRSATHVAKGHALAHLAALALTSAAFHSCTRQACWIEKNAPGWGDSASLGFALLTEIATNMGADGATGGQYLDSVISQKDLLAAYGDAGLDRMIELKTATFFEISFYCGWLVAGGGEPADGEALREAGRRFGMAFQIADDVGDMAQDAEKARNNKPAFNYANHHGVKASMAAVDEHLSQCRAALTRRYLYTPLWREIFAKVYGMVQ